jgi:hypothetical protein
MGNSNIVASRNIGFHFLGLFSRDFAVRSNRREIVKTNNAFASNGSEISLGIVDATPQLLMPVKVCNHSA